VHADIGNDAAGATMSSQVTKLARHANGFNRVSTPRPPVIFRTFSDRFSIRGMIVAVAPNCFCGLETVVVEIDHDDFSGRVELRRQQSARPIGPEPTMAIVVPGWTRPLSTPHSNRSAGCRSA